METSRAIESRPWLGWSLVRLAAVIAVESPERLKAAARHCTEAITFLSKDTQRAEYRCALQILVTFHTNEPGDHAELYRWLGEAKELDRDAPEGSLRAVKLQWLEGLVHRRAGSLEAAAGALRLARDGLLQLDLRYHAAGAGFDLALLYLERGETEAAAALAGEMFPVFKALRVDREATAALKLFVNAAAAGKLTIDLVEDVKQRIDVCAATPTWAEY